MKDPGLTVVDATLRDGGYANNYGFTSENVVEIASGLEAAGITMIEIGHGFGIGANRTLGTMVQTDLEYIGALKGHLDTARFGMFANANIATPRDIRRAAAAGLQFVRVGCIGFSGPHPFTVAVELAAEARQLGLWASINLVRSQSLTYREMETAARAVEKAQLDAVYVVDTTGGALPRQVAEAVRVLRQAGETPVGFHGHQNLDLGVANSLAAVEAGARYVDGTLGGIGRDSGNTQLDVLVVALKKSGWRLDIDSGRLSELTQRLVQPLCPHPIGITADNLLLGQYDLLSHALTLARSVASSLGLEPKVLLEALYEEKPGFEDEQTLRETGRRLLDR